MANILLICFAKRDAGPILTYNMANGFIQNGHKVLCVLSEEVEDKEVWQNTKKIETVFLDTGNSRTFITKTIVFLLKKRKLLNVKSDITEFDVSIQTFGHPWGKIINRKLHPKKSFVVCHDPYPHSGEKIYNTIIGQSTYYMTENLILMTKSFAPYVEKRFRKNKNNIYIMKLGFLRSYSQFVSSTVSQSIVHNYNENNEITFLFFGRVEKYKGIEVLLEAFSEISKKNEFVKLLIAGNGDMGEYEEKINTLKNTKIINRYIPDDEIIDLFKNGKKILVLPYLDATQSGVIPIAIEFGVPILASDSGGLIEQLNDGQIGTIFKSASVNDLISAMQQAITDPNYFISQREQMQKYKKELEWSLITEKFLETVKNRNEKQNS